MADPHYDPQDEIKVEDLLRLKRAERPDEAFWGRFDRELHQRMLQTLVKKDPWYLQLARGLSGRIAQTTAVAAAAALLALVVIRPAVVSWTPASTVEVAEARSVAEPSEASEGRSGGVAKAAASDMGRESASPDYRTERITAEDSGDDAPYKRDFAMDVMQVATNESADYSIESASSWPTFGNTGVASLVY